MHDLIITALAPVLWGTTYLVTTEFLPPGQPFWAAALRALPVGILITLICGKYPQGSWWWRIFVLGVLNIGVFFALLFVAAYRLPGGVVATIGALQPLLVMFISWILFNDHPPTLAIGAGIVGILGVGLLVFDPGAELDPIGLLAAVGGSLSMAAGIVLTKHWGNPVALLPFTAWQLVVGGIVLLPIALIVEGPLPRFSTQNTLGYLWLGIINTGFAYWLWFRGIKHLRPFQISFLGLGSPVVAVILGYVFLSQGFGPGQLAGIGLILVSIIVAQSQASIRSPGKFSRTERGTVSSCTSC